MSTSINIRDEMLRAILTPGIPKPKNHSRKKLSTEVCQRCGLVRKIASTIQINIIDNVIDGRERSHVEYAPLCARCAGKVNL